MVLFAGCQSIVKANGQLPVPKDTVIFTFDDGPNPDHDTTSKLLDVLKKHDIKAVFCLLGENVEKNPELARQIYDAGHTVINHGYSDKWAVNMSGGAFRQNVEKGDAAITSALSDPQADRYLDLYNSRFYRPQGGYYKSVHKNIMRNDGYILAQATMRPADAVKNAVQKDEVVRFVVNKIKKQNGGIILLHDGRDGQARLERALALYPDGCFNRAWIPGAVDEIILELKKDNFTLNGFDIPAIIKKTAEF
ncbi:hypothetical protein AGMMS50212_16710 [Spirochaetia bacterium]|nr:hypothetical protein AGMMS50212_16710 [Spirochaetia bacterium]